MKKDTAAKATENLKNGILEGCAVSCTQSAKVLRLVADKADAAAEYCKSKQTGKFSFGLKFSLGDHEFKFGAAKA